MAQEGNGPASVGSVPAAADAAEAEGVELVRQLEACIARHPAEVAVIALDEAQVAARFRDGMPLLVPEMLGLDATWARRCALAVCEVLAGLGGRIEADEARGVAKEIIGRRIDLVRLVAGREERSLEGGGTGQVMTLIRWSCLAAAYRAYARRLSDLVEGEAWQGGYCPLCGSWPAMAELRGREGPRFLQCACCGTAWPFRRLCCPFCGNTDHRRLGFLYLDEDRGRYRADCCEACRRYLKTVRSPALGGIESAALEDARTTHLDAAAQGKGFQRGAPAFPWTR